MDKYVYLHKDAYTPHWNFLKDDKELELWRTDGSLGDGDYIIEIKSIRRALENKYISIELVVEE